MSSITSVRHRNAVHCGWCAARVQAVGPVCGVPVRHEPQVHPRPDERQPDMRGRVPQRAVPHNGDKCVVQRCRPALPLAQRAVCGFATTVWSVTCRVRSTRAGVCASFQCPTHLNYVAVSGRDDAGQNKKSRRGALWPGSLRWFAARGVPRCRCGEGGADEADAVELILFLYFTEDTHCSSTLTFLVLLSFESHGAQTDSLHSISSRFKNCVLPTPHPPPSLLPSVCSPLSPNRPNPVKLKEQCGVACGALPK